MDFIQLQHIEELEKIFLTLLEDNAQPTLEAMKKQTAIIAGLFKQLLPLEWPTLSDHFDYDVLNSMTDVCEHITALRTSEKSLQDLLFASGLWELSKEMIYQFKKGVYQHPGLANAASETFFMPQEKTPEALTAWAQAALQRAQTASVAAEEATARGTELITQLEKKLHQPNNIDANLIAESQHINQMMFIQNALAAIAADEAATALIEVETWLHTHK